MLLLCAGGGHRQCPNVRAIPHYERHTLECNLCAVHAQRLGRKLRKRAAKLEQTNIGKRSQKEAGYGITIA